MWYGKGIPILYASGFECDRRGSECVVWQQTEKPWHRFYRFEQAVRQTQQNKKARTQGAWLVKLGDVNKRAAIRN